LYNSKKGWISQGQFLNTLGKIVITLVEENSELGKNVLDILQKSWYYIV
jgi:hypothetical protein